MHDRQVTNSDSVNLSQKNIRHKIHRYLVEVKRDERIIKLFTKGNGFCNGLVSLALYSQYLESLDDLPLFNLPQDDWTWFNYTQQTLATWDEQRTSLTTKMMNDIDRFISHINYFQNISDYLPFGQGNLHCYLEDTVGRKLKLEYTFAGLFTANDLTSSLNFTQSQASFGRSIIEVLTQYDKRLILISCGNHSIGLFRHNHQLSLYNPNNREGRVLYSTDQYSQLVSAIFSSYKYNEVEPSPIGFRIFTFDQSPASYPPQKYLLSRINTPLISDSKTRNVDFSALHIATRIGSVECVKYFLEIGAQLEYMAIKKRTALYIAASRGYHSIVQLLVAKNADIHKVCRDDKTPLIRACERKHLSVVKLMLEYEFSLSNLIIALHRLQKKSMQRELISLIDNKILAEMLANVKAVEEQIRQYRASEYYKKTVHHELKRLLQSRTYSMTADLRLFPPKKADRCESDKLHQEQDQRHQLERQIIIS